MKPTNRFSVSFLVSRRLASANLVLLFVVLLVFLMRSASCSSNNSSSNNNGNLEDETRTKVERTAAALTANLSSKRSSDKMIPDVIGSSSSSSASEISHEPKKEFISILNESARQQQAKSESNPATTNELQMQLQNNSSQAATTNSVSLDSMTFPLYMRLLATLACLIIFTVGVCGNLLVPLVVIKTKYLRNSTNLFLINLSVADLLVLIVCMPTVLIELHSRPETWLLGESMCKLSNFIEMFAANGSIFTILAISFERYYAICKPLKAGYKCTRLRATIIICLVWLLSTILTLPILIMAKSSETIYIDGSLVYNCILETDLSWHKWYVFISFIAFFCLPLLVLMLVYWLISRRLIRENLAMSLGNHHPQQQLHQHPNHHQQDSSSIVTTTTTATANSLTNQLLNNQHQKQSLLNGICQRQHKQATCSRSAPININKRSAFVRSIRMKLHNRRTAGVATHQIETTDIEPRPATTTTVIQNNNSETIGGGEQTATGSACILTTSCPSAAAAATTTTTANNCRRHRPISNKSLSLDHHHKLMPQTPRADRNGGSDISRELENANAFASGRSAAAAAAASGIKTNNQSSRINQFRLLSTWHYLVNKLVERLHWNTSTTTTTKWQQQQKQVIDSSGVRGQIGANEMVQPTTRTGIDQRATTIVESMIGNDQIDSRLAKDDDDDRFRGSQEPFLSVKQTTSCGSSNAESQFQVRGIISSAAAALDDCQQHEHHHQRKLRRPLESKKKLSDTERQQPTTDSLRFKFKWAQKGYSVSSSTGESSIYTNSTCLTESSRRSASPVELDGEDHPSSTAVMILNNESDAELMATNEKRNCLLNHQGGSSIESTSGSCGGTSRRTHLLALATQHKEAKKLAADQSGLGGGRKKMMIARFNVDGSSSSPSGAHGSKAGGRRRSSAMMMSVEASIDENGADSGHSMSPSPTSGHSINASFHLDSAATTTATTTQDYLKSSSTSSSPADSSSPAEVFQKCSSARKPTNYQDNDDEDDEVTRRSGAHLSSSSSSTSSPSSASGIENNKSACSPPHNRIIVHEAALNKARHPTPTRNKSNGISFKLNEEEEEHCDDDDEEGASLINFHEGQQIKLSQQQQGQHRLVDGKELLLAEQADQQRSASDELRTRSEEEAQELARSSRPTSRDDDQQQQQQQQQMKLIGWPNINSGSADHQSERSKVNNIPSATRRLTCLLSMENETTTTARQQQQHSNSVAGSSAIERQKSSSLLRTNSNDANDVQSIVGGYQANVVVVHGDDSIGRGERLQTDKTVSVGCDNEKQKDNKQRRVEIQQKQQHQQEHSSRANNSKRQSLRGSFDGFSKLNLVSMANATFQHNFRRFSRRSGSQPLVCSSGHFHCPPSGQRQLQQHHHNCHHHHSHHQHHHHPHGTGIGNGRFASELLIVRDISKKQQMDSRRQVVIMLAFVVACFFLLFFPYRVFTIWLIMSTDDQVQSLGMETYYNLTYFSRILIYLHSAINPIAYNLISTKFRRAFMSILLCRGPATRRHFTTEPHYYNQQQLHHHHASQRLIGNNNSNNSAASNHHHYPTFNNHHQTTSSSANKSSTNNNNNGTLFNKKRSLQLT